MTTRRKTRSVSLIRRIIRTILGITGTVALVMIIMAFTTAPFWIWYKFGVKKAGIHRPPDYIVVMGGGGMPSHSGLMRCWYGAEVAGRFPKAFVIVTLPGSLSDSQSSVNLMKKELEIRGVATNRILLENTGTNTRSEALNIAKEISRETGNGAPGALRKVSLLVVTSPEHLCRSVLTFKKAGFVKVDGVPAFERALEGDLGFSALKLGARGWVPDVGNNLTLRYQFWMQMDYEFLVLREYLAIAYYKLQGWI